MKKIVFILSGTLLSIALLTGCMGMNEAKQDMDSAANDVKNEMQSALPTDDNKNDKTDMTVDTNQFIGEEKAKEMVLSKAGFGADGVTFEKIELEKDDGVWVYEIDFTKDNTEYDAKVKADDGAILKWETEKRD